MDGYREEFRKILEKTYIPTVGDYTKIERELNIFLGNATRNIPERLFRYRKCDNYSFDSFNDGTIYLCNANRFSDKYDSRIYIDRKLVVEELTNGIKDAVSGLLKNIKQKNPEVNSESAAKICYDVEYGLSDEEIIDKIINEQYADYIKEVETEMKSRETRFRGNEKTAKIACFTESVQSKFMWDHYAGGYTGFALEYNLKEFMHKIISDPDSFTYVFPVVYTDVMPDLTIDESNAYMREQCMTVEWMKSWIPIYRSFPLNALHLFKPYLYKDKAEYVHEHEWRMIKYDFKVNDDYLLIPDYDCLKAVYYGPDISSVHRACLHEIAQRRGIAEYDVFFDLESRNYLLKVTHC